MENISHTPGAFNEEYAETPGNPFSSAHSTPFLEALSPQNDQELQEPSILPVLTENAAIGNAFAPTLVQFTPFDHSEVNLAEPHRGSSNCDDHGLLHPVDDGSNAAAATSLRDDPLHSASRATWTPRTGDLSRSSPTGLQLQYFSSATFTDGGQPQHRQLQVPAAGLPSHQHHQATLPGHPGAIHSSALTQFRSTDDCLVAADTNQLQPPISDNTGAGTQAQHGHHQTRVGPIAATSQMGDSLQQQHHALDSIVASDPQHAHHVRSLRRSSARFPELSLGNAQTHSGQLPQPAAPFSATAPGWSASPSTASLPEPVRLQLITGEWITVSAVTANACGSTMPTQFSPMDSAHSGDSPDPISVTATIPVQSIQPRPSSPPDAASGSGVDPCESWELSDSDSEDTHSLSPSQRQQAAEYNKQLVRQQLVGDAVTYSH